MKPESVPTRGRTLDHAAPVYDLFEPIFFFGRQGQYNCHVLSLLDMGHINRVLDIGCGTGVLTRMIADRFQTGSKGTAVGIDAAAKMIRVAVKKRANPYCLFRIMAAENLAFPNESFHAVVSSLFFHHVPLDLKEQALQEAFRVLYPGGQLIVADMHTPTTFIGAMISYSSRWFLLQPEIGENIRGVLPDLMERAGFNKPDLVGSYFGYISIFATHKPR